MAVNTKSRNFRAWQEKRAAQRAEKAKEAAVQGGMTDDSSSEYLDEEDVDLEDVDTSGEDFAEEDELASPALEVEPDKELVKRTFSKEFRAGDTCCLTADVEREMGVFKEGTDVELLTNYLDQGEVMWLVTTLPCSECSLVIKFHVQEELLIEYNKAKPPMVGF